MRKLIVAAVIMGLATVANAGSYVVYVRMHDGTTITFEFSALPSPDAAGMFRFHNKKGGDIFVHASNVWIEEKSNKGKAKAQK